MVMTMVLSSGDGDNGRLTMLTIVMLISSSYDMEQSCMVVLSQDDDW